MNRTITAPLIVALTFIAACGARRPLGQTVMIEGGIGTHKALIIPFSTTGVQVSGYEQSVAPFGRKVAERIAAALRKQGVAAVVAPDGAPGNGKILIEGKVASVDGGSRAARGAVGMFSGAGATSIATEGRVLGEDGRVLGEFKSADAASYAPGGVDYNELLDASVETNGADIADMAIAGQYRKE